MMKQIGSILSLLLRHSLLICTVLFIVAGPGGSAQDYPKDLPVGETRVPPDAMGGDEGYLINFPNVNIIEYIRFISQITKKNFIYKEPELQFSVTILSEEATSIENIIAALVQILRIHGLQLLEQGNNLIIHRNTDIRAVPRVIDDPSGETGIVTRVFQLKNVDPETVTKVIRPLVSAGSLVQVSKSTKHLIVTDIGSNIAQIGKLLRDLDAPNVAYDIGTYVAVSSHVDGLTTLAEKILGPLADENPLVLVPQASTNTIHIVSTPYMIKKAKSIFRTLDVGGKEDGEALPIGHIESTNFYIHKLQYHMGDKIRSSLTEIGTSLAQVETANQPLISTIRSVQWVEASNSLLFTGDNHSLRKVRELVENLDVPLRQVLIEMLIIDTTINDSLSFGIDWSAQIQREDIGAITGSGNASGLAGLLTGLPPNPSSLVSNQGFSLGVIGRTINHGNDSFTSLGALVSALEADSNINIVLNPKIVTMDTSPAEIFVGGTTAFQASQSVSDSGGIITVNVDERDVGTLLKVTPILGPESLVTLTIEQEMSEDLTDKATLTAGQAISLGPITTKSTTKTRVLIPDQNFIIISGMIRERKTNSHNKIPCLGSIPYIGESLFGSTSSGMEKRNLMIFIRPHIITSFEDVENITEKQKSNYYKTMKQEDHVLDLDDIMEPYYP